MVEIKKAISEKDYCRARLLATEYARNFNNEVFTDFLRIELADLRGNFKEPSGILLMARENEDRIGMSVYRKISETEGKIISFAIAEKDKMEKAGKQLLEKILTFAHNQKVTSVSSIIHDSDIILKKLFADVGFVVAHESDIYEGFSKFILTFK